MNKNYLSLCMNFKNEEPYLKEWLDFHILVGVDHFYLYDNNSNDSYEKILEPYRKKGLVTLHKSDKNPIKPISYEYTLKNYSSENRWIGFIDCDEFVVPSKLEDLKQILEEFEQYPAVCPNWKMFGSNNLEEKPSGLVLENYYKRQDERDKRTSQHHIKSFVDPKKTIPKYINPHYFLYDTFLSFPKIPAAVNENFKTIDGNTSSCLEIDNGCRLAFSPEISYDKFSVHHYWCRSRSEFMGRKMMKPRDDNGLQRQNAEKEFLDYNSISNEIEDKTVFRFLSKLGE